MNLSYPCNPEWDTFRRSLIRGACMIYLQYREATEAHD